MKDAPDGIADRIAEFAREDEARRKYIESEFERRAAIRQKMTDPEARFKRELSSLGVDVDALLKESAEGTEHDRGFFDEIQKVDPPPKRSGLLDARSITDGVFEIPDDNIYLFPPAYSVDLETNLTEWWGLNTDLGEVNIKERRRGSGTGLGAIGGTPRECVFWFYFIPPKAGALLVEPRLDFQGSVAFWIENHWWTMPHIALKMSAYVDLYQHYWDGPDSEIVIDEERSDSTSESFWIDKRPNLSKSLSVSSGTPVYIKIGVVLEHCYASAADTEVAFDFRTGAERRIRLEYIRLRLN